MCGRFSLITDKDILIDRFETSIIGPLKKRFNIAPGQESLMILDKEPKSIFLSRWGIIHQKTENNKKKYLMINSRKETLIKKDPENNRLMKKRCMILADGFYEWKTISKKKIPFRIERIDKQPFAFAGIYEKIERTGYAFSIITVPNNNLLKGIHNRMPAILQKKHEKRWLQENDTDILASFLSPHSNNNLHIYQITPLINSPKNDSAQVILPENTLI